MTRIRWVVGRADHPQAARMLGAIDEASDTQDRSPTLDIERAGWRALSVFFGPLYGPRIAMSIGTGMLIPVLPLYLRSIDLSYLGVTTILAAFGVGAVIGQLPAGRLIAFRGPDRVTLVATLLLAGATAALGLTTIAVALMALRAGAGIGETAVILSRQAFMATDVPIRIRGRALAAYGGVTRGAILVGSLIGGWMASTLGFASAFVFAGVAVSVGSVPFVRRLRMDRTPPPAPDRGASAWSVLKTHFRTLWPASLVQLSVIAAREGRLVVIPLLGDSLGLDVAQVGVLVAVGAASDLLLFPLSGWLMDRFGRQSALIPFLAILGGGLVAAGLAETPGWLMVAAAIVGVGNGLGAGTMLTMGADLAPQNDPGRYLAVLGTSREMGRIVGPILVGVLADAVGLSLGAFVLGGIALGAIVVVLKALGETGLEHSIEQPQHRHSGNDRQ